MLPLKVQNRLSLGRPVAAEIACSEQDCRAWLKVTPLFGKDVKWQRGDVTSERRVLDNPEITGYEVNYVRIHNRHLLFRFDLDRAWEDPLTTNDSYVVKTDEELERLLSTWLEDLLLLREPTLVEYPPLPRKRK